MAWRSGLAPRPGAESLAPAPHHGVPRCPGALARGLARRSGLASTLGAEISAPASHQPRTKACRGAPGPWRGDPALPRRLARRSPHQPRAKACRGAPGLGARLGSEIRPCLESWRGDHRTSLAPAPHQGVPTCSRALARGLARRSGLASTRGAEISAPAPHQGLPRCSGPFARGLARRSGLASSHGAEISAQASHQPRTKACRGAPGPWRGDPSLPRRLARRSGLASTLGAEIYAQASRQPRTKACRDAPGPWRGDPALPRRLARRSPHKPRTSPAPRRAEVLRGLGARPGAEIRPCLVAWRGDPRTSLAPAPPQGVPRCSGALARGLTRRSCLASTLGTEISAQASRQPRTKAGGGVPGPGRAAWRGDPALPRRLARRSPHKPRASPAPRRAEVLRGLGARRGAEIRPCLDACRGDPRTSPARPGAEIRPCLDAWRGDLRTSLAPARGLGAEIRPCLDAWLEDLRAKACRGAPWP